MLGVMLAGAAFSAIGGDHVGARPRTVLPAARIVTIPRLDSYRMDYYHMYLFNSEAQLDRMLDLAAGDDFLTPTSSVHIIRTPQDEQSVFDTQRELTALGHLAEVHDLRDLLPE